MVAFGGYANAAEEQMMKYALKTLRKLTIEYPTRVSRGLHELVAKAYGGEVIMPPHLQSGVEKYAMLPPRAPTALELRASRDQSLISSRTQSLE